MRENLTELSRACHADLVVPVLTKVAARGSPKRQKFRSILYYS